jgi:hypothetical protein
MSAVTAAFLKTGKNGYVKRDVTGLLPDATLAGSSRCLVHYQHRMETRDGVERAPDEDFTKQGREDRRRVRQAQDL